MIHSKWAPRLGVFLVLLAFFAIGPITTIHAQQGAAVVAGLKGEEDALKAWHEKLPPECKTKDANGVETDKPYIMVTGDRLGTYAKIGLDMLRLPEAGKFFCVMETQGGYNNALHLAHNLAELGLVQVDALELVGKYDQHVAALRSLVSLYPAAMHIVTTTTSFVNGYVASKGSGWGFTGGETRKLLSLNDLRGLPVAVWSSALVTAQNLNEATGAGMVLVTVTTAQEGLDKVRRGEVAAFIGMGGQPVGWVANLDRNMHLMGLSEIEINAMMGKFPRSGYTRENLIYDNLGQVGVGSIASRVELVVQNFQGRRGENLIALRTAIIEGIDDIREQRGAQTAWKLVTQPDLTLWARYEGPKPKKPAAPVPPSTAGR